MESLNIIIFRTYQEWLKSLDFPHCFTVSFEANDSAGYASYDGGIAYLNSVQFYTHLQEMVTKRFNLSEDGIY